MMRGRDRRQGRRTPLARIGRVGGALAAALLLAVGVGQVGVAHAANQVVTTCDKSHLDAAIAAASPGDTITFACTGTITDNLTIGKDLTLDATGQKVILDGGGSGSVVNVLPGAQLTLMDLTITGGSAADGGGIFNNQGTVTLVNSTVSGNSAGAALGTGGGIFNDGGTVTLRNTILAGNSATASPDCSGTLASDGYNLLGNNSGCAGLANGVNGDQVGGTDAGGSGSVINPQLGPLQDNGGDPKTMALGAGSPAIDAVPQANLLDQNNQPLTTDQRGLPRPDNGEIKGDIGAYEVQDAPTTCPGAPSCPTGTATPELSSSELVGTGVVTALGLLLLRRRRRA